MSDEALINHLVDTRGNLHHHAQRRKEIWHPDKSEAVIAEASALELIVHEIAITAALNTMYAADKNTRLFDSARADGATTNVKIVGYGFKRDGSRVDLIPILATMAGRIIDRIKLQNMHHQFRASRRLSTDEVEIAEYSIRSEDETQIFALWRREGLKPKVSEHTSQSG